MNLDDNITLDPYIYGSDVMELPWADRYALYALMGVLSYVTGFVVGLATDSLVLVVVAAAAAVLGSARVGYAALEGKR